LIMAILFVHLLTVWQWSVNRFIHQTS
jgi:hypothetical protein